MIVSHVSRSRGTRLSGQDCRDQTVGCKAMMPPIKFLIVLGLPVLQVSGRIILQLPLPWSTEILPQYQTELFSNFGIPTQKRTLNKVLKTRIFQKKHYQEQEIETGYSVSRYLLSFDPYHWHMAKWFKKSWHLTVLFYFILFFSQRETGP